MATQFPSSFYPQGKLYSPQLDIGEQLPDMGHSFLAPDPATVPKGASVYAVPVINLKRTGDDTTPYEFPNPLGWGNGTKFQAVS